MAGPSAIPLRLPASSMPGGAALSFYERSDNTTKRASVHREIAADHDADHHDAQKDAAPLYPQIARTEGLAVLVVLHAF